MSAIHRWSLHVLTWVVAGSGVVCLWMKYFVTPADPFSVINHPWQPLMLKLHILSSPLLILVFGLVFESHVARKLKARQGPNRWSGWTSILTFAGMVLSGYALQVVSTAASVRLALVIHLASGVIFIAAYSVHLAVSVLALRVQARQRERVTVPS